MMWKHKIIRVVLGFIVPYIVLYALYIQLNGEVSPGGGFQAGAIFATALIAYSLVYGMDRLGNIFRVEQLVMLSITGVMIYLLTGVVSLFYNDNYLNYSMLNSDPITGQHIGIFLIELGVGLTVSAVLCLIYLRLAGDK